MNIFSSSGIGRHEPIFQKRMGVLGHVHDTNRRYGRLQRQDLRGQLQHGE